MRPCDHGRPYGDCKKCTAEKERQIAGPVSYKQFCIDNQDKLKGIEMRFEWLMVYLPQFPGFDPMESMEQRVRERAKGKVHIFDHTARMEDFSGSPHVVEAIVTKTKTPCGAVTNRVVTDPKRVTCKACLIWLLKEK